MGEKRTYTQNMFASPGRVASAIISASAILASLVPYRTPCPPMPTAPKFFHDSGLPMPELCTRGACGTAPLSAFSAITLHELLLYRTLGAVS